MPNFWKYENIGKLLGVVLYFKWVQNSKLLKKKKKRHDRVVEVSVEVHGPLA